MLIHKIKDALKSFEHFYSPILTACSSIDLRVRSYFSECTTTYSFSKSTLSSNKRNTMYPSLIVVCQICLNYMTLKVISAINLSYAIKPTFPFVRIWITITLVAVSSNLSSLYFAFSAYILALESSLTSKITLSYLGTSFYLNWE